MKLSDLPKSQMAIITKIDLTQIEVTERLSDFGLQIGQTIVCVESSPFGGPKAFRLSHGIFALDKEISDNIEIRKESIS